MATQSEIEQIRVLLIRLNMLEKSDDCPKCGVQPGEGHDINCEIERCSVCGCQRTSCHMNGCGDPRHDRKFARWTGFFPGSLEARALGIGMDTIITQYRKQFFVKPRLR